MDYNEFVKTSGTLTNGQKAKGYAEFFSKPIPEYCPNIICKYSGRNQKEGIWTRYHYPMEGMIFINNHPEMDNLAKYFGGENLSNNVVVRIETTYWGTYIKNIPELNMIEFGRLKMQGGRPDRNLNEDIREWEYINEMPMSNYWAQARMFLFKDDPQPYSISGEPLWPEKTGKYYNKDAVNFLKYFRNYIECGSNVKEIRKFITGSEEAPENSNKFYTLAYAWEWAEGIKTVVPRPESKTAKKYNSAVKEDILLDADQVKEKYKVIIDRRKESEGIKSDPWVYTRVNPDTVMFRKFNDSGSSEKYRSIYYSLSSGQVKEMDHIGNLSETDRVMFDLKNKKSSRLTKDTFGNWKPNRTTRGFYESYIANLSDVMSDCPELYNMFINKSITSRPDNGYALENVSYAYNHKQTTDYSSEYPNIVNFIVKHSNSVKEGYRELFFVFKEPKPGETLQKITGCNTYQLECLETSLAQRAVGGRSYSEFFDPDYYKAFAVVRTVYGNDTASLTNSEFDKIILDFKEMNKGIGWGRNWARECLFTRYNYRWASVDTLQLTPEETQVLKSIYNVYKKIPVELRVIRILCQNISSVRYYYKNGCEKYPKLLDNTIFDKISNLSDLTKLKDEIDDLIAKARTL